MPLLPVRARGSWPHAGATRPSRSFWRVETRAVNTHAALTRDAVTAPAQRLHSTFKVLHSAFTPHSHRIHSAPTAHPQRIHTTSTGQIHGACTVSFLCMRVHPDALSRSAHASPAADACLSMYTVPTRASRSRQRDTAREKGTREQRTCMARLATCLVTRGELVTSRFVW